jgi:hypothetical protein
MVATPSVRRILHIQAAKGQECQNRKSDFSDPFWLQVWILERQPLAPFNSSVRAARRRRHGHRAGRCRCSAVSGILHSE